jgi:hypothetical protein
VIAAATNSPPAAQQRRTIPPRLTAEHRGVCLTVRCMPAEGVGAVRDIPAAGDLVGARTRESNPTGELGCRLPAFPWWENLPM